MKIFVFTIILSLVIHIKSFKPDYFCTKSNNDNCFNYDCGRNLCSIDEKSCRNFIEWENLMKKYVKQDFERTKYNKFIKRIKRCNNNKWIDEFMSPDYYCKKYGLKVQCEIYSCGTKYCSINKQSCDFLLSFENILGGYIKEDWKRKKSKTFLYNIKVCKSNGQIDFKNQWTHRLNFG
jgi:hypothetical protein